MKKLGAGLLIILAGALCGPVAAMAADQKLNVVQPEVSAPTEEAFLTAVSGTVGFIRPAFPYEAQVSQITGDNESTGNRRLLGSGTQIYLELMHPQEVSPGDKFTLYRQVKKVYHPVRGEYLGDLTSILGVVKVLRVQDRKAAVMIERAYGGIYPGDGAMRQTPPVPETAPPSQRLPEGTGLIIELPPGQTLIGQGNIVYVDWGRNDGIKIGDRLEIFRERGGLPLQVIGELQVLAVEDRTATTRIVRSSVPIVQNDRFTAKATSPRQASLEEPSSAQARKDALFKELPPAPGSAAGAMAMSQEAHAAPGSRDIQRELAELTKQLEFDPGIAPATEASRPILQKINTLLKEVPDSRIVVEGHTDSQKIGPSLLGMYKTNKELSRARAASVAGYLAEEGGASRQNISVVGYADTKPVASNGTEEGRKKNRRIEITLLQKGQPSSRAPAPKDIAPEATDVSPPPQEPPPQVTAPPAP
jgi:chemotaxis protein MotB